ncbi:MAG TPA: DUF4194 domain-containing protein, partial [Gammaproteobacteria bacterium]|nr:DUF4194 domain-containing protein [Gammaproteobacteria bacterium]
CYQDRQPDLWNDLLTFQSAVRDYFAVIGLQVIVDETEGYAFLRQQPESGNTDEERPALPRLIQRRSFSYPVSLLCVLLRKKLMELDTAGGETRLILSREQIVDMLQVFLPEKSNEAKIVGQIDSHINKLVEYGFLRRLKSDDEGYEVRRIIRAMVDASWLGEFDQKLTEYQTYADTTV